MCFFPGGVFHLVLLFRPFIPGAAFVSGFSLSLLLGIDWTLHVVNVNECIIDQLWLTNNEAKHQGKKYKHFLLVSFSLERVQIWILYSMLPVSAFLCLSVSRIWNHLFLSVSVPVCLSVSVCCGSVCACPLWNCMCLSIYLCPCVSLHIYWTTQKASHEEGMGYSNKVLQGMKSLTPTDPN